MKIRIFLKGLVHASGEKINLKFFHVFIVGKVSQQNVFDDILERKMRFQALKSASQKSRRITIFPKELYESMVLVKNLKFFLCFYFWQNQPAKCV